VSDRMKKEACIVYFKFHVPGETFHCVTDLKKCVPRSMRNSVNSS
jgi:hypothetical protein